MTSFESSALDFCHRNPHTVATEREQCSRNGGSEMGKHVIVGAGAVGRGVATELAAAGHEVVVVSRSGRAPAVDGVRAATVDAVDAEALTAVVRGADVLYNCANPSDYTKWAKEWPPLSASLLRSAIDTGAAYVIMGNLYGYGPVAGPIT